MRQRTRTRIGTLVVGLLVASAPLTAQDDDAVAGTGGLSLSAGTIRSEAVRSRLEIRWHNAFYLGRKKLDFQGALTAVRGEDPRPLLVLRDTDEGVSKRKDEAALIREALDDERTALASHWFHCVKVDRRVIEKTHPFHPLLGDAKKPPHLLVMSWDGSLSIPLRGKQSPSTILDAMLRVLQADYRKSAPRALKTWVGLLNRFDTLEAKIKPQRRKLLELEAKALKPGAPKSLDHKIAKLRAKLTVLERDFEATRQTEQRVTHLVLRRTPKKKVQTDFDAEVAGRVRASGGKSLLDRVREKQKDKKKK